ncbi:MAG: hypothetical protein GX432_04505 [Candidatus Atribacteria bacterium]|nr:hypothetical protein [Candidatus Atribacteria bacterium]
MEIHRNENVKYKFFKDTQLSAYPNLSFWTNEEREGSDWFIINLQIHRQPEYFNPGLKGNRIKGLT